MSQDIRSTVLIMYFVANPSNRGKIETCTFVKKRQRARLCLLYSDHAMYDFSEYVASLDLLSSANACAVC
jgi:hypothetical protein